MTIRLAASHLVASKAPPRNYAGHSAGQMASH
jgi:hypothetical protein